MTGPLCVYFISGMAVRCFNVYKRGFKPHYRYCYHWDGVPIR